MSSADDMTSAALAAADSVRAEEATRHSTAPADAGLPDANDFEIVGSTQAEPENGNGNGGSTARHVRGPERQRLLPEHLSRELEHQTWLDQQVGEQRAREREAVQRRRLNDQITVRAWRDMLINGEAKFDEIPKELREHEVFGPQFERLRGFVDEATPPTAATPPAPVALTDAKAKARTALAQLISLLRENNRSVAFEQLVTAAKKASANVGWQPANDDELHDLIVEANAESKGEA